MTSNSDELKHIGSMLPGNVEWYTGECEIHKGYRSIRRIGSTASGCPDCANEESERKYQESAREERKSHLFKISGIPKKFMDSGFKNYPIDYPSQEIAVASMRMYVRTLHEHLSDGSGMILCGAIGTGKTRLACALANNAISKLASVRYCTVSDMLTEIKKSYSTEGMTEQGQIDKFVRYLDLLILDEIDVMRGTESDNLLLFQVVNGRNLAMKPTIAITNRKHDELAQYIGDRTADRLLENATIISFDWPGYRKPR